MRDDNSEPRDENPEERGGGTSGPAAEGPPPRRERRRRIERRPSGGEVGGGPLAEEPPARPGDGPEGEDGAEPRAEARASREPSRERRQRRRGGPLADEPADAGEERRGREEGPAEEEAPTRRVERAERAEAPTTARRRGGGSNRSARFAREGRRSSSILGRRGAEDELAEEQAFGEEPQEDERAEEEAFDDEAPEDGYGGDGYYEDGGYEDGGYEDDDDEWYDEDRDTLRDRIGDRVYYTREWVSESPRNMALAMAAIAVSLALFVGAGYWVFSSVFAEEPEPARQEEGAGPDGNPAGGAEAPGDARGLEPAENAGQVRVGVGEDGRVEVVHSVGATEESWEGEVERRPPSEEAEASGDTVYLELSGPTDATFESVLAENQARSWLARLVTTSEDGTYLQATQTSDPGAAALDGRMPVVRGSYVVKGSAGAGLSASGEYEDTLVDESTIERIYSETFVNADGESERREWRVEYNVSGDGALLPFLIGYRPPEAAPAP